MTRPIYPCTIVNDRYSGSYSGALWTAWNMPSEEVPPEIDAGDGDCGAFWHAFTGIVGKGDTPQAAYDDLARKLKE